MCIKGRVEKLKTWRLCVDADRCMNFETQNNEDESEVYDQETVDLLQSICLLVIHLCSLGRTRSFISCSKTAMGLSAPNWNMRLRASLMR